MKRLFLVLLAVAVALIADAQVTHTQDGHLLLYGLRLNSTLQQRKQNLVKNGFRYQKMEDGDLIYKGKFRGKPCEVAIIYDRSNGRVTGFTNP